MDAVVSGPALCTAIIGALCVSGAAIAEPAPVTPADLSGRWVAEKRNLVLDVSPCGTGWCGVEVDGESCGRTALRVGEGETVGNVAVRFAGRLELAAQAQPYTVEAQLHRKNEDGPIVMTIFGNTGDKLEPWRRIFPFRALLARSGAAVCRPDAKVS